MMSEEKDPIYKEFHSYLLLERSYSPNTVVSYEFDLE